MKLDPHTTLRDLPTKIIYNFFPWILLHRGDSLSTVNALPTYWIVLCMFRRQETGGLGMEGSQKRQAQGVSSMEG